MMTNLLSQAIKNPEDILPFMRRQLLFGPNTYYNRVIRGESGFNVMREDWDNLIILDACRYDAFKQVATDLPGDLTKKISCGSASVEWIQNTFQDDVYNDTVYVTANPYVYLEADGQFHDVLHAWRTHWDEDYHTVLPGDMASLMEDAIRKYPNKRIIAHFMQPHRPFIGEDGQKIEDTKGNEGHRQKAMGNDWTWDGDSVFYNLKEGNVSRDRVWNAYIENLEIVMEHVRPLLSKLPGKSAITADHGNGFGERPSRTLGRIYAHPARVYVPQLVEVPWYVSEGERRNITSQDSSTDEDRSYDSGDVEDRLSALGYK